MAYGQYLCSKLCYEVFVMTSISVREGVAFCQYLCSKLCFEVIILASLSHSEGVAYW